MGACRICGQPVPFYVRQHPACAQQAMRAQIKEHWDEVRAAKASGALTMVGVTMFVFDAVRSTEPTASKRVELGTLCWAYLRHVTSWTLPTLIPVYQIHGLVMHTHDGGEFTSWKRTTYTGESYDVRKSLRELMKRAPWALFGFSEDARAAMAAPRRIETTREIDARRHAMRADAPYADAPRDERAAASREIERIHSFRIRGTD